jgi:D-alanyl-D-alanine carboxypeptidase
MNPSYFDWASGAVVSTAVDVAAFYRALLVGRLLPPAEVQLMTAAAGSSPGGYGFGIMKDRMTCGTSWGHAGDTPGFVAVSYNSRDGSDEAVAFMNLDLATAARSTRRAFFQLAANSFCWGREASAATALPSG